MPFSYISTAVYLDFCAYVLNLNGEDLVVTQDHVYKNDFPCLFLPKNEKNWEFMSASSVSKDDIDRIKAAGIEMATHNLTETEFIYRTQGFLNPTKKYKQKVSQFESGYKYAVYEKYDKKKVLKFFGALTIRNGNKENLFQEESDDLFLFCLNNLNKYDIQQVYVEVDGRLAGLVWGVGHSDGKWVNLHIKVDYQYRGLSRFLNYEIAKRFPKTRLVSLGTGCGDEGLIQYKKELGPIEEKEYHYILTRGRK